METLCDLSMNIEYTLYAVYKGTDEQFMMNFPTWISYNDGVFDVNTS